MKKSIFRRSKSMIAFPVFLFVLGVNNLSVSAQAFKVFAVSDLANIFEDGYKLPDKKDSINIFGIRGELLSGQFVINAKKSLTNVTVEISPFKNTESGSTLPAGVADWSFVGSIPLAKNAPNQPLNALVRPAPARFPDYLMAEKQINLKENTFQAVWLTISVPANAAAGNYFGKVIVKNSQGDLSLPVTIKVYPFTLPSDRHLKVVEWYSTGKFALFHGIQKEYSDVWFDMLRIYAENMVAHRQNIFQVPMEAIGIKKSKTNGLEFDFSRFDQIAQVFWNTGKMDYMSCGELTKFGKKEWSDTEISLAEFSVINSESGETIKMQGEEVIPWLLPAFESHLRQKGWLQKTYFGIKDEPSLHNALAWKAVSSYIHKYAPDLKRIDAIETTFLLDEIEVAVPKLDALAAWYDSYKKWQDKGNELWFYTVGIYQGSLLPNKTIDVPVIDSRIMHWLDYKYDIAGYLHWGFNQWTDNPYLDPDIHIGDGWHVYPVKNGLLNSIRWEEMRNGLQDYEYFWMLETKIRVLKDSLGSRFAWIDPKQHGKEIAGRVTMGFADHTDDPEVLYNAKKEIIKELLEFNTSPRIYVQTNPFENTMLTRNSSVEVYGWTDPGTKIVINGQVIPVSKEGLFIEQFGGDFIDPTKIHLGSIVRIEASNGTGSKVIERRFKMR